jgi:hypothetical protein
MIAKVIGWTPNEVLTKNIQRMSEIGPTMKGLNLC